MNIEKTRQETCFSTILNAKMHFSFC